MHLSPNGYGVCLPSRILRVRVSSGAPFMKMSKYQKLAFAIAKQNNWVPHIETSLYKYEGNEGEAYGYFVKFTKERIELCPHCGKAIFHSWSYDENHYQCASGKRGNYLSAHVESDNPNDAWKALVKRYCEVENISIGQLEIKLSVAGLL